MTPRPPRWICLTHEVFADSPESRHGGIAMPCEWVEKEAARSTTLAPRLDSDRIIVTGTRGDVLRFYDAVRSFARSFIMEDRMGIEFCEKGESKSSKGASL